MVRLWLGGATKNDGRHRVEGRCNEEGAVVAIGEYSGISVKLVDSGMSDDAQAE